MKCKYEIDATVIIVVGGLEGTVIARAEYANAEPSYMVRYATPHGPTEQWWGESALKVV